MDAAKKQTLDRLMEIRAGISVIDSINDKKNEFESLIKGLDNDDAQIKDALRLKGEKIEKEKAELKKMEAELSDIPYKLRKLEKSKRTHTAAFILFLIGAIVLAPLAFFLLFVDVMSIVLSFNGTTPDWFMKMLEAVFAAFPWMESLFNLSFAWLIELVFLVLEGVLIYFAIKGGSNLGASKNGIKRFKNNSVSLPDEFARKKEKLAKEEKNYEKLNSETQERLKQNMADKTNFRSCVKNNVATMRNLYDGLVEKHQGFLDPSDWKDLDLLYYYLVTNRSDTIKESLQMLEQKKNTDAIVREVKEAKSSICGTIKTAALAIHSSISYLADEVVKMQNSNKAVLENIDRVNQSLEMSNELASKQIEMIDVNNALREKANTTMEKMVNNYKLVNPKAYL